MRSCEVPAMVLAGGEGRRLLPLTLGRCKPAVAFAGSFRLIDFTLLNCFVSGLSAMHILIQYQAEPLVRHIADRWLPVAREDGRTVNCLRPSRMYSGTADAVFQNLGLLERSGARAALVLSADHIYRADYRRLLDLHVESGADITVLTDRVPAADAWRFGVLSCDRSGRIREFVEKPGPGCRLSGGGLCSINLGVYCFQVEVLKRLLQDNTVEPSHDFGRDILPAAVKSAFVGACPLDLAAVDGQVYWRDVGTMESYFEASMDLLRDPPKFELEDSRWRPDSPFHDWLPARVPAATRRSDGAVEGWNLIGRGARLESADLVGCIVSPRARIGMGARLERCILLPDAVVGPGARLSRVIVDEGCEVPPGTVLDGPGGIAVVSESRSEAQSAPLEAAGAPREGAETARSAGAS